MTEGKKPETMGDSLSVQTEDKLLVEFEAACPVKVVDLFIYADSWTRSLLFHKRYDSLPDGPVCLTGLPGELMAVAIANSPLPLKLEALRNYFSMELLQMNYADEDPAWPVQSGVSSAKDSVRLVLEPLLCEVRVLSLTNCLPGTPLAENIRLFLTEVNAAAEILRFDGFRPVETVDDPAEIKHPEMMEARLRAPVGMYAVRPGLSLFCYPSDGQEGPGTPLPVIVMEYTVGDASYSYSQRLPPLRRGEKTKLDLHFGVF